MLDLGIEASPKDLLKASAHLIDVDEKTDLSEAAKFDLNSWIGF